MTESTVQTLLAIFQATKQGNNNGGAEANQVLEQLYQAPTIFNDLFLISLTSQDPTDRFISLVTIQKALIARINIISAEEVVQLKSFIIEFLSKETIDRNCNYIISIGCSVAGNEKFGGFPELVQCAVSILQNPNRISISLPFWSQLIEEKVITPEMLTNALPFLIDLIVLGFQSTNSEIRIHAIHVICAIELSDVFEQFLEVQPQLLAALQQEAQLSVYSSDNDEECFRLFEMFSFLTSLKCNEFGESVDFFIRFTNSAIKDTSLSPSRRESVLQFFTGLSYSQVDVFQNMLENMIKVTFDILCLKCAEEPDCYQPITSDHFIEHLSAESEWQDEVYSIIMDIVDAQKAAGNAVGLRVSISLLSFITETAAEVLETQSDDIAPLVLETLQIQNPWLFAEVCRLIGLLSQFAFESIEPAFNEIAIMLLKAHQHPESFICLNNLLYNAKEAPKNYTQFIGELLSVMNPQNADVVVPCISGILSHFSQSDTSDENLYSNLRNTLVQMLQQNIARSNVFECFANCIRVAPRLVAEDTPSIMQAMIQDAVEANDPGSITQISQAVSEFAKILPNSLKPFASHFFELFAQYVSKWQNSQNIENCEEDEIEQYQMSYGQALICISFLFTAYPQELQSQFKHIMDIVKKFLDSQERSFVISATSVIQNVSPMLCQVGIDPNTLIDPIIGQIDSEDDTDAIRDLFNALSAILYDNGNVISNEALEKCGRFIFECLNCNIASICSNKFIDTELQGIVMYSLSAFILGGAFSNYGNKVDLIKILLSYLDNPKKRSMQSFAVAALSRICFVLPQSSGEIASMLINGPIIQILSQKSVTESNKNSLLLALMYILASHSQIVTPEIAKGIFPIAESAFASSSVAGSHMLKSTSAVVLILLVAIFNMQIEPGLLSQVLETMPSVDDEGIPVYAKCILILHNANPQTTANIIGKIALAVVASAQWCTCRIDSKEMEAWIQIAKQIPENVVMEMMNYYQADVIKIQNRLAP